MQKAELASYAEHYGLTGDDGLLRYPVYELHGNHDSPHGGGLALEVIAGRNKRRPGVTRISPNGLHYSWDWQGVHFVALGIVVGGSKETARRRRYNALGSYDFLVADLKQSVGDGGRPVVICHHVDLARYTGACDPDAPFEPKNEWDPCDVRAFHEALRAYNVLAILYGHTHVRKVFRWDGRSVTAATGLDVFNTDDASHFKGPNHGILHFHVTDERMTVREYATKDHWQTGAWTQAWSKPIGVRKA
jgi:cytolysin (calcineurin-like family phosphatase)